MPKGPMLDNKRDVSNLFLKDGNQNAALTALGEGVALRAYKDPARGMNIGIGYNMDANAATLAEDFRRAGIPAEHIEEIKAGTKSISREQAMRLYTAVQPRYEAIAQRGVEKLYPGEWAKLPANQRAVLTDVAYQVGSIDKFTTAIDAFLQNDMVTGGEHLVVKYKDRNTGDYKTDYGRHNLRLAMLQSPSSFTNTLSRIK
jgi:GH24 family phage-related lysozyme (muramidase)